MKTVSTLVIALVCGVTAGTATWTVELQSLPAACHPCEEPGPCALLLCEIDYPLLAVMTQR